MDIENIIDSSKQRVKPRRRKGEGSISKKANGTYIGRISISGYDPFTCVGSTEKEVQKKMDAFKKQALKEEVIPQKIFVRDFIKEWMLTVKKPSLKPASYDRVERTFENHIENSPVGRCQLGNVTSRDIQQLINSKTETLSYSSIKKIYELLNSCFTYAVVNRQLSFNPVAAVQLPKQENLAKQPKGIQTFSGEELERIEELMEVTYSTGNARYKHAAFFILLANTGLRAGEALALTWDNVDLNRRLIYVRKNASCVKNREGNGKKYKIIITTVKTKCGNRVIPLNDKAMMALWWLKRNQDENHIVSKYVDCTENGDILSQKNLPKILKDLLKAAEVPYKNVHSFRHTFATNLIESGVDVKVVSQLLGHSSVKVTYDIYVHPKIDQAVDAVNRLM